MKRYRNLRRNLRQSWRRDGEFFVLSIITMVLCCGFVGAFA